LRDLTPQHNPHSALRQAQSRLCAIVDADASTRAGWRPLDVAKAFLDGGATFLQLRVKAEGGGVFLELASAVVELGASAGATVIVNDRADVARLAHAAGVHVGEGDLAPPDVRAIVGADAVIGLSTHTVDQVDRAIDQPVNYVAIGPVFGSVTKSTGYDRVGLVMVGEAAKRARARGLPVVAIGGITLFTAPSLIDAGAASVAVIGDLLTTGNPAARVREYLRALG
jgi:thiamine-phosphate pyrophosphorylase